MDFILLHKGFIIGLSIAAPVGPISMLCIRRTMAEGRKSGVVSGIGAATADAIYGAIAGFGLTFISSFLIDQQIWLRPIGGVFLLYMGFKTFLTKPFEQPYIAKRDSLAGTFASTFILTLTNPMTILAFTAIFAGLGLAGGGYIFAAISIMGIFTGSAIWWIILSYGVSVLRVKFTHGLLWINRISGIIITLFGLVALLSLRGLE